MKRFLLFILFFLPSLVMAQQAITFDWWSDGEVPEAPPPEPVVWEDHFEMTATTSGGSISPTWNSDVTPQLINLGTGSNWVTVSDATKPNFNGVSALVWTSTNLDRIDSPTSYVVHPPVFEVWVRGNFTADSGTLLSLGNNSVFGIFSDGGFYSLGMSQTTPGDFNEHVFRIVLNGATSILQIDNGTPISFDEGNSFSTRMSLGIKLSGGDPADVVIKSFERTADGVILTPAQVAAKWVEEGF